jgi:hypothetical protein
MPGGASASNGDGDADGDVDGNDFLVWQQNLGSGTPVSVDAAAVPEPAAAAMLLAALLSAISIRRVATH